MLFPSKTLSAMAAGRYFVFLHPRRCRHSVARAGLMIALCAQIGCNQPPPSPLTESATADAQSVRPAKIIAQGQLLPAGGLIRLNGAPGDTVESILVKVGQEVTAGQPLIELRSAAYRQSQLDTLRQQLTEAELQKAAAVDRAQIELSAARMQLSQAQEQIQSIKRREGSLPLLKRQWDDAQAALERAEAMAKDPLTRALVSRLDIDKQRSAATASELQYEQQRESLTQAQESAQWAHKLAEQKLSAAQKSLELAEQTDPASVLRSQIKGAEQQLAAARIVSPIDGTVVSLDARVGESVAQFPLVQVADLSRMVCQVEIYQTDAPLVKIGQPAELRGDAFSKPLRATVTRVDRLIGHPQLRSTDPLAKVDYRTLPVLLDVAAEDTATASQWLQLQVEVTIPLDEPAHSNSGGAAGPSATSVPSSTSTIPAMPTTPLTPTTPSTTEGQASGTAAS